MPFSHSFVIPSYNQGQYLAATLESLLKQDDPCSEIVISEDYSTDNSLEIAKAYADKYPGKIRLLVPPEHKGMYPNWNWAISQTKTEWISVMASDDQALPNFVSSIREGIAKSPNVVVVGGNWHFVDGNDNLLFTEKVLSLPEVMRPPQTFYLQLFANRVHPAAHAFRRDAWEKVGGFIDEVKLYGDWAFWLRLTPLGDFVHMRRVIARYRINYRPGLELARMNQIIQDEVTIRLDLIPRIARQFTNVSQWRLNLASRRRFRHMLNRISIDLNGADPSDQAKLFEPWAHELGPAALRLLDRFSRGEPIGLDWFDSNVVLPVREIYKNFQPSTPTRKSPVAVAVEPAVPSIVVPIEPGEAGWNETLASAFAQTTACEVVVVAADDKVRAEVEAAFGDRAKIVTAPAGIESPTGVGVATASGDWIFVARPGLVLPVALVDSIKELAAKTPEAVALLSGPSFPNWPQTFMHAAEHSLHEPPPFAFRKSAWTAVGGYQPEIRELDDRALLLKLSLQGRCVGGLSLGTTARRPPRHWDVLHDAEFVNRMLVPTLMLRRGGIQRREIEKASRRALRSLVNASVPLEQADRERAAELMSDWAMHLDEEGMLDCLRQGRTVPANRPMKTLKRRLRKFYRSLR